MACRLAWIAWPTPRAFTSVTEASCWSPLTCCSEEWAPAHELHCAIPRGAAVAHAPAALPGRLVRPVPAALDLPARDQGLRGHGRAPGGQPQGARGRQF